MSAIKYFLGIDLGGSQLRFILADPENGNIKNIVPGKNSKISFDSPLDDKKAVFDSSLFSGISDSRKVEAYVINKLQIYLDKLAVKKEEVTGIGISVAGKILKDKRFIGSNVPIKYTVEANGAYGVDILTGIRNLFPKSAKIYIENDANCSGLVQAMFYKHMGIEPYATFFITVSTGIGGGGPKKDLDEVGHVIVDGYFPKLVPKCGCSSFGCIEAYASGEGMKNQAINILKLYIGDKKSFEEFNTFENIRTQGKYDLKTMVAQSVLTHLYLGGKNINTKKIFEMANIEKDKDYTDKFAKYIIEISAERFAKVLLTISNIHGIERFGIGGTVVTQNPKYIGLVNNILSKEENASYDIFKSKLIIELSPLGEYIADYGALSLLVDSSHENHWFDTLAKVSQSQKK